MTTLNFQPTATGFRSDPITANAASVAIHLEFDSSSQVRFLHSITDSNYTLCKMINVSSTYEVTVTGLMPGQNIIVETTQQPKLAGYLA